VSPRHGARQQCHWFLAIPEQCADVLLRHSLASSGAATAPLNCEALNLHLASAVNGFVGHLDVNSDCYHESTVPPAQSRFPARARCPANPTTSTGVVPRSGWRQLRDSYGAPFFA